MAKCKVCFLRSFYHWHNAEHLTNKPFRQRKTNYPDQKVASKLTIAERTVFQAEVLSLAQLARREDKFSVTLPSQLQASSSWKARAHRVQVILRTKKRWS